MACRYSLRSAWVRGPWTAGPFERLRRRNWMPAASATRPIRPSRASISRTKWPLPRPPIAGLHDISPIVAKAWVTSAVRAPMRAAAAAASVPACPPPTTMTSYVLLVLFMGQDLPHPANRQKAVCRPEISALGGRERKWPLRIRKSFHVKLSGLTCQCRIG